MLLQSAASIYIDLPSFLTKLWATNRSTTDFEAARDEALPQVELKGRKMISFRAKFLCNLLTPSRRQKRRDHMLPMKQ